MMIPFNKPYPSGNELEYIRQAIESRKIAGDGLFTSKCHSFFEKRYGFNKVLLTTSCTDALEMAAILLDIKEGDEVIMPSYTFVSSANPFVARGAKIIFADSQTRHPNMDVNSIKSLITARTKAIVPVHYAGMACDMDEIMKLANHHKIIVVEDAAQAIDSYYKEKPLGSIGHLGAFSFHETKNIVCGEGGMLVINDKRFLERAEIIREKGTDRSKFIRGEIDKYGWVDIGSSFLPSEMIAAFLLAQCEQIDRIQAKRTNIWEWYYEKLKELGNKKIVELPELPSFATNNGHAFYITCKSPAERQSLIKYLKEREISAVFHYQSLHKSKYYSHRHDGRDLPNADRFTECLLRLPLYYEMEKEIVNRVCDAVMEFFNK